MSAVISIVIKIRDAVTVSLLPASGISMRDHWGREVGALRGPPPLWDRDGGDYWCVKTPDVVVIMG